jgi:hypothetical protein
MGDGEAPKQNTASTPERKQGYGGRLRRDPEMDERGPVPAAVAATLASAPDD